VTSPAVEPRSPVVEVTSPVVELVETTPVTSDAAKLAEVGD
jgi:hypothetical protein